MDFAVAAAAAGADRVELCANLVEGGTTPSMGSVALAVERCSVPVMVMIRPRGGDFLYGDLEFDVMLRDLELVRDAGAYGVVLGVLRKDGTVDVARTKTLVDAARPMSVTFHRAFDVSRDLFESLEALCDVGVDRVLTSVGRASALDDLTTLAELVTRADSRLSLMACGGVREHNVADVLAVDGVREIHIGASRTVASPMSFRAPGVTMGATYEPDEYVREVADVDAIGAVAARMSSAEGTADPVRSGTG